MKCPNCQRENEPTSLFCIFCGSPLGTQAGYPSQSAPGSQDVTPPLPSSIQDELRRLREQVAHINDRLANLELRQGLAVPSAEPVHPRAPLPTLPAPEVWRGETAVPTAAAPPPPVPPAKARPAKPREWEQILGGNWLARIGVVALIIGAAFFLQFAFANNWLGPLARVILGIVVGLAMVGGGYYWRTKYPTLAQAITGGGIALLYLSIFAAFAIFQLMPFYPAVLLLLLVSAGSAALALRHNSMALAIIGILGAFIAPFILGAFGPGVPGGRQTGTAIQLLVYVWVVDLGVIALSTFRNWRWFTLLALVSSLAAFGGWYGHFGDRVSLLVSEVGLTIIFLIFVGATTLYHLVWRRVAQGFDYTLMSLNAAAYFGISLGIMWGSLRPWMGGFSLLVALFYGGLAYLTLRRGIETLRLSFFYLGIALVFLTIAVPVQFGDKAWATIAWAAEGTVLMWLSFRFGISQFRWYSYAVFAVTTLRLLFFDTIVDAAEYQPILNERVLAFAVSISAMYLTSYILRRQRVALAQPTKTTQVAYLAFVAAANFFSLWLIGAEVISGVASHANLTITVPGSLLPVLFILLAGVTTIYHGVWLRSNLVFDVVIMVVDAVAYVSISALLWQDFRAWMGGLYFILAIFYAGLVYFCLRKGAESARLGSFAAGIAIIFVTLAIPVQFGDKAWTTIAWAAEVVVLVWLSLALRIAQLRWFGFGVFIIMAVRLLFFDTTLDMRTFRPILNERFLAYLAGIAALYLSAYLLWRGRERVPDWAALASTFLIAGNFFTLWVLSFEIWNSFDTRTLMTGRALRSAQNLSLTALWAVYAVILLVIGIAKRWRVVRLGALALLAVSIVKVFVYDVWVLERLYRIIAFVGLGVLLLVSAYLYQRYSKAIRGFLLKS